jgi:hypothetical protein
LAKATPFPLYLPRNKNTRLDAWHDNFQLLSAMEWAASKNSGRHIYRTSQIGGSGVSTTKQKSNQGGAWKNDGD